MEDRRRQSVAFENVAKEMLKYLEYKKELKVCITELQEHWEVPVHTGTTLQQWLSKRGKNQKAGQGGMRWKGLVELERRSQDISRDIQMLSKRQELFKNAVESKLGVQRSAKEMICGDTKKRKRRSKKIAGRQETEEGHGNGSGATKKRVKKDRLGRGERDGRKRVEAGA